VAISGWIVDPDRKKMAKSKGNVMVPNELLDEFGSDGCRYWSASARLGVDTTFDRNVMREGKRLATKIRNAARLIRGFEGDSGIPDNPLDLALLARLRAAVQEITAKWESWDHAGALEATESWFWSDFTDNYLELTKARAYAGDPSALATLRLALDIVLRLFAPVLPYATEEVWNAERAHPSSIHLAHWPTVDELPEGPDDGTFTAAVQVLAQIRRAKSEAKVSIKTPVEQLHVVGPADALARLESVMADVVATGNVEKYELSADGTDALTASVTLGSPEGR
jgi:valyl-tRNA synthetase